MPRQYAPELRRRVIDLIEGADPFERSLGWSSQPKPRPVPSRCRRTFGRARDRNNRIENDHGRLKARLRPMRGLRVDRTSSIVI